MRKTRRTSSNHVHFSQPLVSTSHSSTVSSSGPIQEPSITSSQEILELIEDSTSTLTPSPPISPMSHHRGRETPPHLSESDPFLGLLEPLHLLPNHRYLLSTLNYRLGLMTAMSRQFRAEARATRSPSPPMRDHSHSKVNARDPDPYDGPDPVKLCAFYHSTSCKLVFRAWPREFREDIVKITYAGSNRISHSLNITFHAYFAYNWDAFEEMLKNSFGEPDPVQKCYAQARKPAHAGLDANYYRGLAPRIKDGLVFAGKHDNHADLRTVAINLDMRHWERKDEDKTKSASGSAQGSSKSHQWASSATSTSTGSSRAKSSNPKSTSRSSTPATSKKPDLSKVLGPQCAISAHAGSYILST